MLTSTLPVPLARAVMAFMPPAALARCVKVIVRRMEGRHPKLFKNLARLDPALVHLVPTDLPHRFALRMGSDQVSFFVLQEETETPDAQVSGRLESLIDMLEGRADGDTLFFSRDIDVTGDTSVIVGLRNTLDREEINLYEEVISLCGPFAPQAGFILSFLDRAAHRVKDRVSLIHEEIHCERS